MAGSKCPNCKKNTLFKTATGLKCNNPDCTYELYVPANDGKGGKGQQCKNCGQFTVFNDKCRSCGAYCK